MEVMSRLRKLVGRGNPDYSARIPVGLSEALRSGPTPCTRKAPAPGTKLDVAFLVPSFGQVSGGHTTIVGVIRALEARGHRCSVWILDDDAFYDSKPTQLSESFIEYFGPLQGPVFDGFDQWQGADVIVATGWQTTPMALTLPDVAARAYLVQDHEPEFFATSAERMWATWTYSQGLHCIAASEWLAQIATGTYGATASTFDIAVDHATYQPSTATRRDDLLLFYSRAGTPRRGVPLGLIALEYFHQRYPDVEIALFGETRRTRTPFPHTHLGVQTRPQLSQLYSSATAGMVLSLTNPSLIPNEMLACGLPCVDIDVPSARVGHTAATAIDFGSPTGEGLGERLCALFADRQLRQERSSCGPQAVAHLTWERTGQQVEAGLQAALAAQANRS